jgi:hydroxypyruvate reductase
MPQDSSESELLRQLFERAVQAALPAHALKEVLPKPPVGRTLVLGAGKAAASMALALDELWPKDHLLSGLVVTRYDHIPQVKGLERCRIEMLEAAHPVPDEAGVRASERMLALTQGLSKNDLVICLISGGGSSLLTLPVPGLTLEDKRALNQALLKSGANIEEMNCVRKHLSQIKGGRLALACAPAKLVCFAISDVPGDDPAVIASGPTVADPSTCADALAVLTKYKIEIPEQIRQALERGDLETPKPGADFAHCERVQLIATPKQSLLAAAQLAKSLGLNAYILADDMEGESKDVAKVHAALAKEVAKQIDAPDQPSFCAFKTPCVILSGGETTVTISKASPSLDARIDGALGKGGRGGRAGEFCLSLAKELSEHPRIWAIAADTDGIDGVEANAGAVVLPQTLDKAKQQGLNISAYLSAHDSYSFFEAIGDLVVTGPTYTNVNDFRAILIK